MKNFRSFAMCGLAALTLSMTACGGRQPGARSFNSEIESAYDVIPADAAIAFSASGEGMAGVPRSPSSLLGAQSNPFEGTWLSEVVDIDKLSEGVVFVRDAALWFVIRVEDPGAALESLRAGEGVEERRIGRRPVLRKLSDGEGYVTDVVISGRYLISRVGFVASTDVVDAELIQLASGWPGVGRLTASQAYQSVLNRAAVGEVTSIASLDLAGLNRSMKALEGSEFNVASVIEGYGQGGVDAADCAALEARILANFPGAIQVQGVAADGTKRAFGRTRLSSEGRARARQLFSGSVNLANVVPNALFTSAFSFDYGAFVSGLKAEPRHVGCTGIAAVAGYIASQTREMAQEIQFNRRTISGNVGMVVQDVDFSGFVPTASAAFVLHSPNAPELLDRAVRVLNRNGSGDVVPETSVPTLQYTITGFPVRFRVMQGADRLVVALGNVEDSTQVALLNEPMNGASRPYAEVFVNGARVQALIDAFELYLREMEVVDPQTIDDNNALLEYLRSMPDTHIRSVVSDEGLDSESIMTPR